MQFQPNLAPQTQPAGAARTTAGKAAPNRPQRRTAAAEMASPYLHRFSENPTKPIILLDKTSGMEEQAEVLQGLNPSPVDSAS
jgi:hypothetical protein